MNKPDARTVAFGAHGLMILVGFIRVGWPDVLALVLLSAVSLVFILFPEQINRATMGLGGFRHPRINTETPGCLIAAFGWAMTALELYLVYRFVRYGVPK